MSDFAIDRVHQLKWLLLVLACAAVLIYGFARKKRALLAFASPNLLPTLAPDVSRPRQLLKAALLLAAMSAIVLALVGPRFGTYWEDVQQRQLDIIVCLDVSKSMLAQDAGMSRLDRAKDDLKRLLDRLDGGLIGIVCFAGRAQLVCPLTDDYEFVRLAVDDIGIQSAPLGGTNIGDALEAATKALGDQKLHHRAIILLSDGEDHGQTALLQAQKAKAQNIQVFTIGIGDDQRGGRIPVQDDGRPSYLMHDGEQVWTKMDPTTLKEIAAAGGGEYQPSRQVNSRQRTLEWIYSERLAPKEERSMKEKRVPRKYARFTWPAALALVLLIIESLISERRTPQPRARRPSPKNASIATTPAITGAALLLLLRSASALAQPIPPKPDDLRAAARAVKEGNQLLKDGGYSDALEKYNEAHGKAPDAPEIAYDRGLAFYRLQQFDKAATAFQDAIKPGHPELEAKAKYNLGRCAHAEALARKFDDPQHPEELNAAVNDLAKAVAFYNDALQLAPNDVDAQTNKAAAERLKAFLEQLLQQQKKQQKKDQKNSSSQPTSQPEQQQPSSQPSAQPSTQPQEQMESDQKNGKEQEKKDDQQNQNEQPKPGDKKDEQQQQNGQANEKPREGGEEQQSGENQQSEGEQKDHKLTAEQAEPMLQEARDAERQRREAKRMRLLRERGRTPVDKDW